MAGFLIQQNGSYRQAQNKNSCLQLKLLGASKKTIQIKYYIRNTSYTFVFELEKKNYNYRHKILGGIWISHTFSHKNNSFVYHNLLIITIWWEKGQSIKYTQELRTLIQVYTYECTVIGIVKFTGYNSLVYVKDKTYRCMTIVRHNFVN